MRKLLPIILALFGLASGVGVGMFMRPVPDATAEDHPTEQSPEQQPDYVKISNQFVVPVVVDGRVEAMVLLSLSLELTQGSREAIYAKEPKLRDAFLQVLFDHANSGGFRGTFTDGANLLLLRRALLEVAQKTMGPVISDVLITEIARQDG